MRRRDTSDVLASAAAACVDMLSVFGGFMLAVWARLDSGWIPLKHEAPPDRALIYGVFGAAVAGIYLLVFRALKLYVRPQTGSFLDKIPRLVRGCGAGLLLTAVLGFALQNEVDISRGVILLSGPAALAAVLLERWLLFRVEWNLSRHSSARNRVLILGADAVAARLKQTLSREPMLRSRVVGFLRTIDEPPDPAVPPEMIAGGLERLPDMVSRGCVDQVILADSRLGHERIVEIILLCERNLIAFNMVPDLFRVMTSSMDVQSLDDIPLLGISRWPLDIFWNRVVKRAEDIVGAVLGIVAAAPVLAVAALLIRRTSPGPALYRQERCGERGRPFMLYKLRTMRAGAEDATGPVFTKENDPRVTPVGAFLRRHNLDELPQFWNVLRGEMSLVGPRPERPHFVERFKEDIGRYMWRHVSKPGMTGWAQVNGLRGNTSIEERIKYDLYYLEKWSLAFDLKIILKTFFTRRNAY